MLTESTPMMMNAGATSRGFAKLFLGRVRLGFNMIGAV